LKSLGIYPIDLKTVKGDYMYYRLVLPSLTFNFQWKNVIEIIQLLMLLSSFGKSVLYMYIVKGNLILSLVNENSDNLY